MELRSTAADEHYYQGDERGHAMDFFRPLSSKKQLHESFLKLNEQVKFSPARGIIEPMMRWYEDLDGNFVEQFQTTGFDARIWELYLFATFSEMGYRIEQDHAVPDFTCVGVSWQFTVEAMTVNPTKERDGSDAPLPPINTPEQFQHFQRDYMPIKFASTLTSKLKKRYWEKPAAKGKPLLFAIQNFSVPVFVPSASWALPSYLYGSSYRGARETDGRVTYTHERIDDHRWKEKTIESGFFGLPDAENVSAVVFNKSGTISKFNRMGVLGGFGSRKVVLVRRGTAFDSDPDAFVPHEFIHVVNAPWYSETWTEGLEVFHNPRAIRPMRPEMLPGATHWLLEDGEMKGFGDVFLPLESITHSQVANSEEEASRIVDALMPKQKGVELKGSGEPAV